ncbi:TraB/GumN family protein [Alteromonas oceanisediminis]|uniref:TraB/GumN family protein n=1 Tax=Alteromonas oceanisediminis TaxID=2836180 RepID=UPI001BDB0594|nr:TraB/GumN family protein [Alteromonas oceanisediminis]MBT0587474.1 TraB/GumN family protein [Alteromonas oceanisediminis]
MLRRAMLAGLIALLSYTSATAAAPAWKVSKGDEYLYIGGTIHVLSSQDYPLPAPFEKAYQDAEWIVFETDINALSSAEFQQQVMNTLTYTDGTTFHSTLNDDTIAALDKHFTSRGVPMQNFVTFKPSFLALTLSNIEFQLIGLTSDGVDHYYAKRARNDGKRVAWLESPTEQLSFMESLGKGEENELITYTLAEIDTLAASVNELRTQWRAGDMEGLAESQLTDMVNDFPAVYDDLLVQRNNRWLPQIEAMFISPEKEFVLVGALHLAGEHSVLKMLADKGYHVEKFSGEQHGQ